MSFLILAMSPTMWLLAGSIGFMVLWKCWQNRSLWSIPAYGGLLSFSSALSARRLGSKGREECQKAYAENPLTLVPITEGWGVLAHSKFVDEISRAPDDVLSFVDAATQAIHMKYTFGPKALTEHYHVHVVRNQLTRHLSGIFPELHDETMLAVTDFVKPKGNEWQSIQVFSLSQKVITRASNRVFLGESLCRNEDWSALMITIAIDTVQVSQFINKFPAFLRPLAGWYSSPAVKHLNDAMKMAGPMLKQRIADHKYGESDDYISWMIENAPDHERNAEDLLSRILMINFASIHTSSATLTNALYWLMARSRYVEPLLAEINDVTSRLGWTKESVGAMVKLDSFVKECMRITPFGTQAIARKVRKPFTFSNGVKVPAGMTISAHLYATHHDEELYPHADAFDGFRFVNPSSGDDEKEKEKAGGEGAGAKRTMYTTSRSYLAFGHGRHACPGRFFASTEIKLILAYLIANYEMKWPDSVYGSDVPGYTEEGYRPPENAHGHGMSPDTKAKMMMRRRVVAE